MINWLSLDTLFLDMDGTLLDLHYDNYFWLEHLPLRYGQTFNLTSAQARNHIVPMIQAERGSLNWYCTDYWSERLSLNIALLKTEVRDRIGFRPHVKTFLSAVRERGLRTVIVTNCHPDPLALKLDATGLDRLVDRVISSHDLGKPKEAHEFWTELNHWEPYQAARTLMVDDSFAVLESASAAGVGQCLGVLAPDSRQKPQPPHPEIPAIHHFDELLDSLESATALHPTS